MVHGEPVLFSLYIYAPNAVAPVIFTAAYGVTAVCFIGQILYVLNLPQIGPTSLKVTTISRYKAFGWIGLQTICAFMFTLGYALRIYGAHDNYLYRTDTKMPLITFIISQVCIYVCPPLLELSNYHVLGRVFHYVPYSAPIPAGKVLGTFGGLMFAVELLNSLGVSLAANPSAGPTQQKFGGPLIIAAITIQLAVILIFIGLATLFHRRCVKAGANVRNVSIILYTLYASMTLIFCRCIYRLVEHTGHTRKKISSMESLRQLSPLFRYEAFFYIFEASFMLINSVLWITFCPARYLPRDYHRYLAQDGTEREGQKEVDDRSTWAKATHVLTFGLLFSRRTTDYAAVELAGLRSSMNGDADSRSALHRQHSGTGGTF